LEIEKNKKRYILELNNNNNNNINDQEKEDKKFKELFKDINIEVKSFYPKSYLKMVQNEENKSCVNKPYNLEGKENKNYKQ
jgi:hypothetical protein